MKKSVFLAIILMLAVLPAGCSRGNDPQQTEVNNLLNDESKAAKGVSADSGQMNRLKTGAPKKSGRLMNVTDAIPIMGASIGGASAPQHFVFRGASPITTNSFDKMPENTFKEAATAPLSTFSIDVDTASYAVAKRFMEEGTWPPAGAVRTEELINYFRYSYSAPQDSAPCAITADMGPAFWNPAHRLLRVALKSREIDWSKRMPSNIVFLLDVSGSMEGPDRLGLIKKSMKLLVEQLDKRDRVSIVTYASSDRIALPPTSGAEKSKILAALENLEAGGGTAGSKGIVTAYELAQKQFIKKGINRVILCTDGDFNVGVSSPGDLVELIREQAKSNVFLSVFGFGMGNYKDSTLVRLGNAGNGTYAYINSPLEARRLFVEQIGATLVTIAKDVKIQVEFNPEKVKSYRLIGYEKRQLQAEQFNDDSVDAGDMGAGHTVTALYEVIPADADTKSNVDPLRYTSAAPKKDLTHDEWAQIKLRYKEPAGTKSQLMTKIVKDADYTNSPDPDFRMASAVAAFGMLLNTSPHKGTASLAQVMEIIQDPSVSSDIYRKDFIGMVAKAIQIDALGNHQ